MEETANTAPATTEIPQREFEALHALYHNKQEWVRHYETMLSQVTPISTTATLGIAAYMAEAGTHGPISLVLLAVPLLLIGFTLWFNRWCDREIRRQFDQIVLAEKGMGFYNYKVEGNDVLPQRYLKSPVKTRPIIYAGYIMQLVGLCVVLFLATSVSFKL